MMRILLQELPDSSATAVVRELIGAGHQVLGLARSDAARNRLPPAGAEVHRGSISTTWTACGAERPPRMA